MRISQDDQYAIVSRCVELHGIGGASKNRIDYSDLERAF